MKLIECRCGRILSVQNDDGSIEMHYKRRVVNFWPPARITCQNCGFTKALDREKEAVVH